MNDKCFISVIVPVYNAEQYLDSCLTSILAYGDNIEVICINDGSTDDSLALCNKYKEKDVRVKVISQTNMGVSMARNKGIECASGKWIMFVDADDMVTKDYYSAVEQLDQDCDIGLFSFSSDGNINLPNMQSIIIDKDTHILVSKALQAKQLSKGSLCNLRSPWSKAFQKDFIIKHKIRFPKDVIIAEDMIFNIHAYSLAKKIHYLPTIVYDFCTRGDSATRRLVTDMMERVVFALKALKQAILDIHLEKDVLAEYNIFCQFCILRCLKSHVFNGNYSYKKKATLLEQLLNNEILKNGFNMTNDFWDGGFKRNIIILLVKYKMVMVLDLLFYFRNLRS